MKKYNHTKGKCPGVFLWRRTAVWLAAGSLLAGCLSGCGRADIGEYNSQDVSAAEEAYDTEYEYSYAESETSTQDDYLGSIYDYSIEDDRAVPGTEEYSSITESGFSSVRTAPLSTFSADVDTASYSNLRRLIRDGYGISSLPEGSVRIEEMLNYFTYNGYNDPGRSEPFGVTTEISACPWNPETELMMIGLKTEDIDYASAPASNLVFLLDVSGSMMDADKLPLLQESFTMLTENLTDKDCVSIVTYAGSDEIVLDGVEGNHYDTIIDALNSLEAGGSTYGSQGIITAYELAEEHFIKGGNNRVILATDGDLNVGLTSESELEDLITEKKESGVFLSVLGFGTGNIKDNKMETLADRGNGNYAYIDSLNEAQKVLVDEMGATLLTICKDVKFQVEFNPAVVREYRLLGYENRRLENQDFQDDARDGGEIGAGHSVTALYEVGLVEPLGGLSAEETEDLKYAQNHEQEIEGDSSAYSEEWLTISIRYKKPAGDTSSLLTYPVDYDSYSIDPGNDWKFAAAVAEFGLVISESENRGDGSVSHVISELRRLDMDDDYKEEFYSLVRQMEQNG